MVTVVYLILPHSHKNVEMKPPLAIFFCLYQQNLFWYHQNPYMPTGAKLYLQKPNARTPWSYSIQNHVILMDAFREPAYIICNAMSRDSTWHRPGLGLDCFTLLLARHLAGVSCYIAKPLGTWNRLGLELIIDASPRSDYWPALCAGLLCCNFFDMLTPVPFCHFFSSLILLFIYV